MLPEQIIWIAVFLELLGSSWYIKDIIYGNTKPNLVSWVIWVLAPFFGFFFAIKAGAGLSALPIFMAGFESLLVVIVSILNKKAYWKLKTFDIICGIFAIISLIVYIVTHNLSVSIFFAILSDFLAFFPTYVKGWKFPETESNVSYFCYFFANIIGLLVITKWSFAIYSFGLYFVIANIVMLFILYRKKIFKN